MTNTGLLQIDRGISAALQRKPRRMTNRKSATVLDPSDDSVGQVVRAAALMKLTVSAGQHLLEIGFGTGHGLVELAGAVGRQGVACSIDLSEEVVASTRALLKHEGLSDRARILRSDPERLPYGSNSMDGIVITFILELLDPLRLPRVLAECGRVLRHGGQLVIAGVSEEGKSGFLVRAFQGSNGDSREPLSWQRMHGRGLLERCGLVGVECGIQQMEVPIEIIVATKR
jgi:precorrin-6B methylase 2